VFNKGKTNNHFLIVLVDEKEYQYLFMAVFTS